jgi:signal transduction histidine kinase/ActR/RegA family two-component response regulator
MTQDPATYPFPAVPRPVRHFVALTAVIIAFLASRTTPAVDEGGLFLLMSITVVGAAWFAGVSSALAVTVLGATLAAIRASGEQRVAVHIHLALFILEGLLLTALVAELRRARRVAENAASDAEVARRDVEAASRMKDEFLGTISHELRTPLNAVLGWLHLVRSGKLDRATETRGLEAIERNVRLQAQLTADLLDVSRTLTGRLHLDMAPLSLKWVVEQAVSQVTSAATAKDVTLHVKTVPGQPTVRGDVNRLRQIVWHLLANAIKFTPRGGEIFLTLETNDMACITVRDTGPGVAHDFLPRVFDRFTQADSSPTRGAGGLGVGLSLVRELVERHGGDIKVANHPDGGALFTVRLPLHPEDQQITSVRPVTAFTGTAPLDGVRVLLVDRDRDSRELLCVALQQRGAAVRVAGNVDEALEALEAWRPDVLVSDTVTPERDGYSLVGKVRALEADRGGRIPALALTSFARTDEGMRRLLSDVKRDLPKPVEPAILTAEIARLAGRERRRAVRN